MNPYKLTFKLKQHTPIIHFQHDQHGATLRASELKPKLDKFLIEKSFGGILNFDSYKEFLIGDTKSIEKELKRIDDNPRVNEKEIAKSEFLSKQKLAFDYKVKMNSNSQKIDGLKDNKTFFGAMGHEGEKEYTYTDKIIDVSISTFRDNSRINQLKIFIEEIFPFFIAQTNFGTRQNKGNGSFYIDKSDSVNFTNIEKVLPSGTPYISISVNDDESIFNIIDYYYKRLKAGINLNFDSRCSGEYHKSYLYQYFHKITQNGWEKRFIKEEFLGLYKDSEDKYFIRAWLGLPGSFTFKKTKEPCHKKNDKKIITSYEILDDYEIEVYHPEIERFKSPINFKPIKYTDKTIIFILPQINEVLKTSRKFILYKKFIVKTISDKGGKIKINSSVVPERLGTRKNKMENLVNILNEQEKMVDKYLKKVNAIPIEKKKRSLTKNINDYIKGQNERFDEYLKLCTIENENYIPPHCEIELPNINLNLNDLIKKYNEEELKGKLSTENISATINVTK